MLRRLLLSPSLLAIACVAPFPSLPTASDDGNDGSTTVGVASTTEPPMASTGLATGDDASSGDTGPLACGDGLLDEGEECDLGADNGMGGYCRSDCMENECGDGYLGPGEGCDDGNTNGGDACTPECGLVSCGDGRVQPPEQCDEGAANSQTGACLPSCLDASCGDLFIQAGVESCDGTNIAGATCGGLGFDGGTVICSADCSALDTSDCYECGNSVVEANEDCDMGSFDGATCGDFTPGGTTPSGGSLTCTAECAIDSNGCTYCGDGLREGTEACDGAQLGGATCASVNPVFDGGSLSCSATCNLDSSGCTDCGDGNAEGTEECDQADLNGGTCVTEGFMGGTLGCNNGSCSYNTSNCFTCGNGVIEGPEICDGAALGGVTCQALGMGFACGTLSCAASCMSFDANNCSLAGGQPCTGNWQCCSGNCNAGSGLCTNP